MIASPTTTPRTTSSERSGERSQCRKLISFKSASTEILEVVTHREAFAEEMSRRLNIEVRAVDDPRKAVHGADILSSCTDSMAPVYDAEWIEKGVVPVADRLVSIAGRVLSDKYRASEIAEYAVHSLSRTHGSEIGDRPSIKVLNRARFHAEDLRVGGRRARRNLDADRCAHSFAERLRVSG